MAELQTREPELFASGDSLVFQRYLPGYRPADGWSLHYTVTAPDGALLAAVSSTANGDWHVVEEDNFLATVDAAYPFPVAAVLAGYAINGDARHQIYYGQLTLTPNLGDGTDDTAAAGEPVKTEAQQMLETLRAALLDAYKVVYQEVNLSGSKVVWANITKLREELAYWKEVRRNEVAMERARAGRPTGMQSVPVFCIG